MVAEDQGLRDQLLAINRPVLFQARIPVGQAGGIETLDFHILPAKQPHQFVDERHKRRKRAAKGGVELHASLIDASERGTGVLVWLAANYRGPKFANGGGTTGHCYRVVAEQVFNGDVEQIDRAVALP